MAEKRRQLEETARVLRSRLRELQTTPVSEQERAIREVGIQAVRAKLSEVGRLLARLAA